MKTIITAGSFDQMNSKHVYLINEMRKLVVPNGNIFALVFDDYSWFKRNGCFPTQRIDHRINNLNYFVREIFVIGKETFVDGFNILDGDVIFAVLRGDEEGILPIERHWLKKSNIPIRFIKNPKPWQNQE